MDTKQLQFGTLHHNQHQHNKKIQGNRQTVRYKEAMMKYDVVIVGAGVAGLYCAIHLPKEFKVLVVCKGEPWECNTFYAQGGITIATDEEDISSHIEDTIKAGAKVNDLRSVELLSYLSLGLVEEFAKLGLEVDRDEKGNILYAKEGGHQKARIIHFDGDGTGRHLHTRLMTKLIAPLWKRAQVVDLMIDDGHCYGVVVQSKNELIPIYANHIVLASGGVGGLYRYHTNASSISSDLHGMILENGLKLKDMEMLQFHPTVYTQAPTARKPLISEAVRGEGGKIVNARGERFLFEYDSRGELAPRDIVSRGIFDYMQKTSEKVFLDLSNFTQEGFKKRFPNIYHSLSSYRLDIPKERIPISPAFHYSMGGIQTDINGKVDGVDNLYAIGECANNGIHGANRLASNSLLEGVVFGKRVAEQIVGDCSNSKRIFPILKENLQEDADEKLKNTLRNIMWDKVGIVRTQDGLNSALGGVEAMLEGKIGRMLRLRLLVAKEIILQALKRKESLGAHYRRDK